ncbi:hypothetical protein [Kitasatospora sp. NPDC057936]|uniref:hypothetical protein n=1 Tax=Kitasatospora sp. NPDC057936 TaxID=3346283 RepID=UPI0036DD9F5D
MNPLDILLTGGGIGAAGPTPIYDAESSRRRIAQRLATQRARRTADERPARQDTCFCSASASLEPSAPAVPAARQPTERQRSRPGGPRPENLSIHDYADRDLLTLASMVINEDWASSALHQLGHDADVRLDPRGALVFACLLYLVGRYQEAQFWWQFAGGAEEPTACYALYLHHARLGELKAAQHWFLEAARLEASPPKGDVRPPAVPPLADYVLLCLPIAGDYRAPTAVPHPPDPALREALDELEPVRDEEYGPISLPSDDLAGQLQDLATAN